MKPLIETLDLTKTYSGTTIPALHKLNISVNSGEVYGFLGANGAGKSTTIRTLLNFIQPSSGSAKIMGLDIVRDSVSVKRHVGYLAGDVALWQGVTGHELFSYLGKLQQKDCTAYLKELIARFEAEPEKKISDLSKGNRQKIGVIQALMHQPEVIIMDEPTSGLDPLMQEVFYEFIGEAKDRGAAVLVSSHNLSETQRMCNRIGIIKKGRLIREQSINDNSSLDTPLFRVVLGKASDISKLKADKTLKIVSVKGSTAILQPTGAIGPALRQLGSYNIVGFVSQQLDLEDEFLEYYGDGA